MRNSYFDFLEINNNIASRIRKIKMNYHLM